MNRFTWGRNWPGGLIDLGQGTWQVLDQSDKSLPRVVIAGIVSEWQAKLTAAVLNGIPEPV